MRPTQRKAALYAAIGFRASLEHLLAGAQGVRSREGIEVTEGIRHHPAPASQASAGAGHVNVQSRRQLSSGCAIAATNLNRDWSA